MPKIEVGDVELYYEIHGEGPPVVLIHGLAGDCSAWAPQIKVLENDYRVIALDNRGAGRSSSPDYPYTTRHFADDTVGLMDALEIAEPAHVIGRSMGGAIAQEMAINYPGTRSAICFAAPTEQRTSSPPARTSVGHLTRPRRSRASCSRQACVEFV